MADLTPVDPSTVQETGPESAPGNDHASIIQRLEDEIARLRGDKANASPAYTPPEQPPPFETPAPFTPSPAPSTVPDTSEANSANATSRPLLEGVDHPTLESGAPDMREPGPHQNPVSYAHLSNGDVVKVAGLVPTYIHVGEELLRVIASFPMLAKDGKQMLAGLLKSL